MLRVAVDLDGVLLSYKTSEHFDLEENEMPYGKFGELLEGARESLQRLREMGAEIVIVTPRINKATLRSYLENTLRLPFDRIVSPANNLAYDVHLGAGCVQFSGNWTKALSEIKKVLEYGTWEEKRLRGRAKLGMTMAQKGYV